MVRPTQPKGIKPKAEVSVSNEKVGGGGGLNGIKLIIVNTVITVLICLLFVVTNYFIVQNSTTALLHKVGSIVAGEGSAEGDGHSEGEEEKVERGLIIDLGEFIINLSET
jgi:hypothetical protein